MTRLKIKALIKRFESKYPGFTLSYVGVWDDFVPSYYHFILYHNRLVVDDYFFRDSEAMSDWIEGFDPQKGA